MHTIGTASITIIWEYTLNTTGTMYIVNNYKQPSEVHNHYVLNGLFHVLDFILKYSNKAFTGLIANKIQSFILPVFYAIH